MNIRRNAAWNIAEVVATTITQLVIFRVIIAQLGISALGIWSLVFSTLSFARIADVGVAGTLTRFIAKAPSDSETAIQPLAYVETALLTNVFLYSGLAVLLYLPAYYALGWAVHGANLNSARNLLPYATFSFIILNIAGVIVSGLTGFLRSDLKSLLSVISLGFQLGISLLAIRGYGLVGLAFAQIAQNVFLVTVGWLQLLRISKSETLWRLPSGFSMPAFREMIGFAIRLQALNVVNFLYDPLTKFTISAAAGPAALGMYEAAYRLIIQARAIIVAPAQNLPPMFASIKPADLAGRRLLYDNATALMLVVSVVGAMVLIVISPIVSLLLLRHIEPSYTVWVAILSAGWLLNIVAVPAYLMGVGCGWVKWNIVGMTFSTLMSVFCGYFLGTVFGATGVVAAAAFAIGGGGMIVMFANCRTGGIASPMPSLAAYAGLIAQFRRDDGQKLKQFRAR